MTSADPLDLLTRYKLLCENVGAYRTNGMQVPKDLRDLLERIESELQTRLWMAASSEGGRPGNGGGQPSPARPAQKAAPKPRVSLYPDDILAPNAPTPSYKIPSAPTAKPTAKPAVSSSGPAASDSKPAILSPSASGSPSATVFTDGACQGNPGPGGYGAIVRMLGYADRKLWGGKPQTTNNEMEMTAAVEGLKAAVEQGAGEIVVISDSEYLVKGMTGWIKGWMKNGWKTSTGSPVKNKALWQELHRLTQGHTVTWTWTRGHVGHKENEECDSLAVAAAKQAAKGR